MNGKRIVRTAVLMAVFAPAAVILLSVPARSGDETPPAQVRETAKSASVNPIGRNHPPTAAPMAEMSAAVVTDPAFDRYVDLSLLGDVLREQDAARLSDMGLQLAEGERILLRPHRSGVTAQTVMEKAATLAAQKGDTASLERLARAAESISDKKLLTHIRNARKLGGLSRAIDPAFHISVENTTPSAFAALKDLLDRVKTAELLGDADGLKEAEGILKQATELSQSQQEAVKKRIAAAREAMPQKRGASDQALQKLSASSRGWGIKDLDPFNKNSGINKTGRQIDQHRLDVMQGARFSVTIRNPTDHPINYRVNDMPFLLMKHMRQTITGRGTPTITFDYGLGNGSFRSYNLSNGGTYHFGWKRDNVAEIGQVWLLDLYNN